MKRKKFIISGGGTGGHIFPALAIAEELKLKYGDCDILFVGANGRMEMEKIPDAGYEIKGLDVVGIQRSFSIKSIFKNLSFPFLLYKSLLNAKRIISSFKPDVVIGVGGYASGPTLRMSNKLGIPTLIQEQNSYAGLTNKWLSKKVNCICVAYQNMHQFFPQSKIVVTGNPVRQDLINIASKRDEAMNFFKLKKDHKVILIIGGSLGAKSINEGVLSSLDVIKDKPVQLLWQVGKRYQEKIENELQQTKVDNVLNRAFIKRMDLAYAAADVVISRAGALSISEITLIGKPSILIPSPNVSEDHQTKNALSLVNQNAALLIKDDEAKKALESAVKLIDDTNQMHVISSNAKSMGKPNATKDIVVEISKLVDKF